MMAEYYIGVDVGSHSVRAGLLDIVGNLVGVAVREIRVWNPKEDFYQQSSEDIWAACCDACREVAGKAEAGKIIGIGFDATCSLVVLDKSFYPLSVDSTEKDKSEQNVIMWMDHRAKEQAEYINKKGHSLLKYVGGTISPEMQPPKILWLKQNMPQTWWKNSLGYLIDLPDFLTWRATKSLDRVFLIRSYCSVVCKWLHDAGDEKSLGGWSKEFLQDIGLEELLDNNSQKIGQYMQGPGTPCGNGLTKESAVRMGLRPGIPVGASIIDAYAGALCLFSCQPEMTLNLKGITSRIALICGTSTCLLTVSETAKFVPGVWGPYRSVMIPDLWVNEGGQSASGKLLDHIIENHAAYLKSRSSKKKFYHELHDVLEELQKEHQYVDVAHLAANYHVVADFHGNRSPLADPTLKGMISGISLDSGIKSLALNYLATIQALAYNIKHIITTLQKYGYFFDSIFVCGGLAQNDLYVTTHADVTGLPIIRPREQECVVIGSAMLGALASGRFREMEEVMKTLGGNGEVLLPKEHNRKYHKCKYEVYLKMINHQKEYRNVMNSNNRHA